uniref:NADH-ubiquinone oxidoreductase chain 5 n=1 Tax=Eosembia sp. FS-2017 TaxID=2021303 RepID=A0A678PBY3_9NEOP|nr:NADH dehydrogenase subunit 5 [Eosembia sp. FS-2017]
MMYINVIFICVGFVLGILSLLMGVLSVDMMISDYFIFFEWELGGINYMEFEFVFWLDWISCLFSSLVMMISFMILLYSIWYMSGDFNIYRFFFLVFMFVVSMLMVILSPNLISIILGWDGLGLVSYCLIIYYMNWSSYVSGIITIMFNRLGDIGILMGIGYMVSFGDWNTSVFWNHFFDDEFFCMFLLMLAGLTKSAQIPFCSWLPIAMAAPTPVSSLVHSSTLVTAGVYLMIRYFEVFNLGVLSILIYLGGLTMIVSGFVAIWEYDLSKIIALSTLSQLGLMYLVVSLGLIDLAFFHLVIHAFFSAMLFMCSGILIHSMGGLQDIRYMSGLFKNVPEVLLLILVSSFSLSGIPFFMGFYSKDLIIEICMVGDLNYLVLIMLISSVVLTLLYTVRIYIYIIFDFMNFKSLFVYSKDFSVFLVFSSWFMMILVLFFGGYFFEIIFPFMNYVILSDFLSLFILLILSITFLMGICLYFLSKFFNFVFDIIGFLYFFDFFMGMFIYMPSLSLWNSLNFMNLGYLTSKNLEGGWIESMGGQGLNFILMNMSISIQWFQDESMFKHLFFCLLFIMFMLVLLF